MRIKEARMEEWEREEQRSGDVGAKERGCGGKDRKEWECRSDVGG